MRIIILTIMVITILFIASYTPKDKAAAGFTTDGVEHMYVILSHECNNGQNTKGTKFCSNLGFYQNYLLKYVKILLSNAQFSIC